MKNLFNPMRKTNQSSIDWNQFLLGILRLILLIIVFINLNFHFIYWLNYSNQLSSEYGRKNHLVIAVFISILLTNLILMILTFQDSMKTLIVCVMIAIINICFIQNISLKHGLYRLLIGYHSFLINILTYICFIVYSFIRLTILGDDYYIIDRMTMKKKLVDDDDDNQSSIITNTTTPINDE